MFTGLIESTGVITGVRRRARNVELTVRPDRDGFDCAIGASVAVDGVCLTVETSASGLLVFTAVLETASRTTVGSAVPGRKVNLERALRLGDRLEGHLVLGHVDEVGRVLRDRDEGGSTLRTIAVPAEIGGLLAGKGSVAVDGVSLTIVESRAREFSVAIVPHTWQSTALASRRPGEPVNIECDVIARYLRQLLRAGEPGRSMTGGRPSTGSLLDRLEGQEW